ncbi:BREX system ATP-binding domain-containing protein [Bradyrhizobium sp. 33ap4]|uniref:BREX system ATP-binding domain-containing protein n=1 Tax=Bradyrhizobium sp. 33ap4 TaxID=3061630 RepID=UPI00292F081F|nr:BREX system ATP-binding domain-containing protein [Bradyrhizobium sp. 33ap4]
MSELARAAIRKLRTGVVPTWELARLSVGYDRIRLDLERSLDELGEQEHCGPMFVRGEWGTGKTHFLAYVRTAAARHWHASARIDLNARGMSLSHPQRFLSLIADSVQAGDQVGIQDVLHRLITITEVRQRVHEFSETIQAGDLGPAMRALCSEFESCGALGLANHAAWSVIRGADLSWSDDPSKRAKALSRIAALAGLCRAIGLKGLILILDEAETIDQLWNVRSRLAAYAVLGQLFEMKSLWCVLGSTLRFDRTVQSDLSGGILADASVSADARRFLHGWKERSYRVVEPPMIDRGSAGELAKAVSSLYQLAYALLPGDVEAVSARCVEDWMRNPVRNPRRLVRLLVHRLDAMRKLDPYEAT